MKIYVNYASLEADLRPERCPDIVLRTAIHKDNLVAGFRANPQPASVKFNAAARIDRRIGAKADFHTAGETGDPAALQAATLARIGMPDEITMRHAAPHFGHFFISEADMLSIFSNRFLGQKITKPTQKWYR